MYLGTLLLFPAICSYSSLGLDILPTCLLIKENQKEDKKEQQKSPCMPCCSFQCHCDIMIIDYTFQSSHDGDNIHIMSITDDIISSLYSKSNWQPPEII